MTTNRELRLEMVVYGFYHELYRRLYDLPVLNGRFEMAWRDPTEIWRLQHEALLVHLDPESWS